MCVIFYLGANNYFYFNDQKCISFKIKGLPFKMLLISKVSIFYKNKIMYTFFKIQNDKIYHRD